MRVLIAGATRDTGRAIAVRLAERYGTNLIMGMMARSNTRSHTLQRVARDVSEHGSVAVQLPTDFRDTWSIRSSVSKFVNASGGIDLLVKNSSVRVSNPPKQTNDKRMSLLYEVNTRGTMVLMDECRDALSSGSGSIVTVSPPIRLGRLEWISAHGVPYTMSQYSMTLATLAEATTNGIRANCIWPRHAISTNGEGGGDVRDVVDFANAVVRLGVNDVRRNGECLFDDDVLPSLPPNPNAPLNPYAEPRLNDRMRRN